MRTKTNPDFSLAYVLEIRRAAKNVRPAPRRPSEWNKYLYYLRTQLLGLTQQEFWGLFDVKIGTGAKYERLSDNPRLTRQIPEEIFHSIMKLLDLEWEEAKTYGRFDDSGKYQVRPEGLKALELLERAKVSPKDLAALIALHQHYRK